MVKYLSTYIAIICALVACGDNPGSTANDPSNKTPESHAGMILVEGSKKAITLGTNKKGAKESETPELKAILNYDYFMDATEVTCNEFKKVMKGEKIAKAIDCDKDGPVTDITFFDAVLFANKKSKNESLDSALRRFKRSCAKAGIQQEIRKREHYEKPSVKRKKKSEAARKRKYN